MERLQMNETWELNIFRHIQTQKNKISKLAKMSVQTKKKINVSNAGNAIRKLCSSQATKNVFVDRSAKSLRAQWDGEKTKE